jgi:hypothetical protein
LSKGGGAAFPSRFVSEEAYLLKIDCRSRRIMTGNFEGFGLKTFISPQEDYPTSWLR